MKTDPYLCVGFCCYEVITPLQVRRVIEIYLIRFKSYLLIIREIVIIFN